MKGHKEETALGQNADLKDLIEIGIALSSEKNTNKLLQKIATAARRVSRAEGVTVYICSEDQKRLIFAVVQNEKLDPSFTNDVASTIWPHINLYHEDGTENHNNVSANCALTGKAVSIGDVYHEEGYDFSGTREFDKKSQYHSKSMLLIPMSDHQGDVIGVLQLLNCKSESGKEIIPFPASLIEIITGLASQAAIALTNVRLVNQTEHLLKSFVKAIAYAIDEKSPYTAGHIARVVQITENLAKAIHASNSEPFQHVTFSPDELEEIRLAAWLHDIGKIATPQFIVDKATKLETVVDRIELIRLRLEILKRDIEFDRLKRDDFAAAPEKNADSGSPLPQMQSEVLESIDAFLLEINRGQEFLRDDEIRRVKELAELSVNVQGVTTPLINESEIECCMIRKGTLTEREREIINRHAIITNEMLSQLPFPKKWQRVPEYAGSHHEKLDGSGYPVGLTGENISIPVRIIAIADIFEALTAPDRPYKTGLKLSKAVKILEYMARDNQLDRDICDLLMEQGIALAYARINLPLKQLDGYCWKGNQYDVVI